MLGVLSFLGVVTASNDYAKLDVLLDRLERALKQERSDDNKEYVCYKKSYGRGAGTVLTGCNEGMEKNGALCYPQCDEGYYGVGPVCWESCESKGDGWVSSGIYCKQGATQMADTSDCPWSNKCGLGWWSGKGCSKCPEGYDNKGCMCSPKKELKKSYGRGVGEPMICEAGLEKDGALCYEPCNFGYDGVGPVCWFQCEMSTKYPAGQGALCCDSKETCMKKNQELAKAGFKALESFASGGVSGAAKDTIKLGGDLWLPICSDEEIPASSTSGM